MIGYFNNIEPISRDQAEKEFRSNDSARICKALVRLVHYDQDYKWLQKKCLEFLASDNYDVKRVAVVCFGHIARIHNKLDKDRIIPVLEKLRTQADFGGVVDDALDDIEMFLG